MEPPLTAAVVAARSPRSQANASPATKFPSFRRNNVPASSLPVVHKITDWMDVKKNNRFLSEERIGRLPPGAEIGSAVLAGTFAFGSTLALSTVTQQRVLTISTGTMLGIPSLVGALSVFMASVVAHGAALSAYKLVQPLRNDQYKLPILTTLRQRSTRLSKNPSFKMKSNARRRKLAHPHGDDILLFGGIFRLPLHTIRIGLIGMLAFKLLGGRFWSIAPSSYTHLGSFARPMLASLPATESYASPTKRAALERMGKMFGCHTCGSRRIFAHRPALVKRAFNFVGDHMPPKSVAEQMNQRWYRKWLGLGPVQFRFYPQCVDCSGIQGGLLSAATQELRKHRSLRRWAAPSLAKAGGGANSYFHGFTPRWNHWAGGILGAVAVVNASPFDIFQDDNRSRYRMYQDQLLQWCRRQKPPSWEW